MTTPDSDIDPDREPATPTEVTDDPEVDEGDRVESALEVSLDEDDYR